MPEILTFLERAGIPAAIAFLVIFRLELKLDKLIEGVNRITPPTECRWRKDD